MYLGAACGPVWLADTMGRPIDVMSRCLVEPDGEPFDLDEAKKLLRFLSTSEDTLIEAMITAARQYFEQMTGVICMTQTWELAFAATPAGTEFELPRAPLQSVSSIVGTADGIETTCPPESYTCLSSVGGDGKRGRVQLVSGAAWPTTTAGSGALRIAYVAGFGTEPADVPALIRYAIGMLIGHFFKFRAEVHEQQSGAIAQVPFGAQQVMREYAGRNLAQQYPRSTWG